MSRRAVRGVLHNFLSTYTSRNTDHNGYWLFGMVINDLEELTIDLLDTEKPASNVSAIEIAAILAAQKFQEQMRKAGISISKTRDASVTIRKIPGLTKGLVNHRPTTGHTVQMAAKVVLESGFTCERESSVFVAPHDPGVEIRSTRFS